MDICEKSSYYVMYVKIQFIQLFRAVYGFVSYLLSSAALAAYLVWLLLPQEYLEATGLAEIFPQKYWAVAVPIYLGVSCTLGT